MSGLPGDLREAHVVGAQTRELIISTQRCPALRHYHIALAGISYALPPFRFVRPQSAISQLLVCVDGVGSVWLDGSWRSCAAGMAYLTPPGAFHAYHALSDQPWQLCWVQFAYADINPAPVLTSAPQLFVVEPLELSCALSGLYHESLGAGDPVVMQHWSHLVHVYVQRMLSPHASDGRLLQLWKLVDANLAYPWSNDELAARVLMSSEHLRRLCQQQYGYSPMKWVTAMRMQRAMALLTTDSSTIESVALRVGYENPFAFSTAFKRYAGSAPSLYREQARLT